MQDKREIGYCVDRLEKTQYFKKEKGNKITFSTSEKLKSLKFRGSHNFRRSKAKVFVSVNCLKESHSKRNDKPPIRTINTIGVKTKAKQKKAAN